MGTKFVSDEERQLIINMYNSGATLGDTARQFGRSDITVRKLLRQAGIKIRGANASWFGEDLDQIYTLYEQGYNAFQISKKIGRNYTSVLRYLQKKYGGVPATPKDAKKECKTCLYRSANAIHHTEKEKCLYFDKTGKLRGCTPYNWTDEAGGDGCDKWEPLY